MRAQTASYGEWEAGDNLGGLPFGSALVVVLGWGGWRYKAKWEVAVKQQSNGWVRKSARGTGGFWKQMQGVGHAGGCQLDASGVWKVDFNL